MSKRIRHEPSEEDLIEMRSFVLGTKAFVQLSKARMIDKLSGTLKRDKFEVAIHGMYLRAHSWMESLAIYESPLHSQAAAAACRGVFENLIDLKLSFAQPSDANKYSAFTNIRKFVGGWRLNEFFKAKGVKRSGEFKTARAYGRNKKYEAKAVSDSLRAWGPNRKGKPQWPDHWSNLSLEARIERLGSEAFEIGKDYRFAIFIFNNYLHAGSSGPIGMSAPGILYCFNFAHIMSQTYFAKAVMLVADHFKFLVPDPELRGLVERATILPIEFQDAARKDLLKKIAEKGDATAASGKL